MTKRKKILISLPRELVDSLRARKKESGQSVSWQIERALKELLEEEKRT